MSLTQSERGYPPPITHVGVPKAILQEKGKAHSLIKMWKNRSYGTKHDTNWEYRFNKAVCKDNLCVKTYM